MGNVMRSRNTEIAPTAVLFRREDTCLSGNQLHDSLANNLVQAIRVRGVAWRGASWAEVHRGVGEDGRHASRFEEDEAVSSAMPSAVRSPALVSILQL